MLRCGAADHEHHHADQHGPVRVAIEDRIQECTGARLPPGEPGELPVDTIQDL
jgi:hypothetical protein